MRRFLLFALAFFFLSLSLRAELYDKIVAVVNGEPITLSDIGAVKLIRGLTDMDAKAMDELMKKVDEAIEYTLLLQEAKKLHIQISDDEVQRTIDSILKRSGMDREKLKEVLKEEGVTYSVYEKMVKARLVKARILSSIIKPRVTVNKKDVEKFYEKNAKRYTGSLERKVLQIYVPKGEKGKIIKAYELLKEGKPFSEVCREYGDPSQMSLGWVRKGELMEPLNTVIFTTKVGFCSEPIETKYGYHILCVQKERRAPPPPFKKVEKMVERDYYETKLREEYNKWLDSIKKSSVIEINM